MHPLPPSRHRSPAPVVHGGEPTSVAALLRREGRGRHAVDRPLVPRGHSRAEPPPPRHSIRKAGAATGALFALGAVFGATVLEESHSRPGAGPWAGGGGNGSTLDRPPSGGLSPAGDADLVTPAAEASVLPEPGDGAPTVTGTDLAGAALDRGAGGAGAGTPAAPGDPAPDPAAPTSPTTPGGPAPDEPPPADDGPGGGGSDPGGCEPGEDGPGTDRPGDDDTGPDAPGTGPGLTAPLPDVATAPVEAPGADLPGTPVATPRIAVGEAALATPDLSLTSEDDGLDLSASDTAVTTPDVSLADTELKVPDLAVPEQSLTGVPALSEVPAVEAVTTTVGSLLGG